MQRTSPAAIQWDPAHGFPPEAFDRLARGWSLGDAESGPPISSLLLVAGSSAWQDQWGVRTAIAVADRLSAGRQCILCDLAVDGGELHGALNCENFEGVADIFLYGASLKHVIQKPAGHRFEFVPAGLGGDSLRVLTDTRWRRLLSEVEAAKTLLLAYVPANAAGIELLSERIPRAIALCQPDELNSISSRLSPEAQILASIAPPSPVAEAPVEPPTRRETHDVSDSGPARTSDRDFESIRVPRNAAREALIADLRARQRSALMAQPHLGQQPEETPRAKAASAPSETVVRPSKRPQPSLSEPSFATALPRTPVKSRRGLYIGLSLVVIAALAVGAWVILSRNAEVSVTAPADSAAVTPPPAPRNATVLLPFSIAIEAHQELTLAVERVNALASEEKDIGFYIAPILVDSVLYYAIMAGPVADSASATALMRQLLAKGHKTGAAASDLRQTPLAYLIGEYDSDSDAKARAAESGQLGIPAYVIEVNDSTGTHHRVYAGAYSGLAEAEVMRQLLRSAGLPDSLVERIGIRK
jgi:hypothetical protein